MIWFLIGALLGVLPGIIYAIFSKRNTRQIDACASSSEALNYILHQNQARLANEHMFNSKFGVYNTNNSINPNDRRL